MKRVLLVAVGLLVTVSAFAQQPAVSPVLPQVDPNEMDQVPGKPCPMCMMKGQHMFQPQLVALSDGSALLMFGGKLYKYDQDLNLVAQTDLQIDYDQLQMQLQEMMSRCPLCKQKASQYGQNNGQIGAPTNGVKPKSEKSEVKPKTPGR